MTSAVPQGSVLGPLLFLVYNNDIVTTTSSIIRMFADDCVICRTVSDYNDVSTLQKDLNNITSWCHTWELGNTAKCYYVSFSKIKKIVDSSYHIGPQALKKVSEVKYFGGTLSADLTFNHHIDKTVKKQLVYLCTCVCTYSIATFAMLLHL